MGPNWIISRAQAVAESLLFGNQPFIADMTAHALNHPDDTAKNMAVAYQRRIALLLEELSVAPYLVPLAPDSGMFMVVDVSATGLDGAAFANRLLDYGVAAMPGESFGAQANGFIRLSLTVADEDLRRAAQRIVKCADSERSDGQ